MCTKRGSGLSSAAIVLLLCCGVPAAAQEVTTVYLVRHCETTGSGADPGLSELGIARAGDLCEVLRNADLAAAYAPNTLRARSTAAPTVVSGDLPLTLYSSVNRDDLRHDHPDQAVLVVADGDALPGLVNTLGGMGPLSVVADEYDNLIVLRLEEQQTTMSRHRYGPLTKLGELKVVGDVLNGHDMSGVVSLGSRLVVCSDETTSVQEFELRPDGKYDALTPFPLPVKKPALELDLEGLALSDGVLYAIGSRPPSRARLDLPTYAENRAALKDIGDSSKRKRCVIYRLAVDGAGDLSWIGELDLADIILSQQYLKAFRGVPGQENGIDVEGLAVDGDWLVLGLRGPVLRGNLTPIVRIKPNGTFQSAKKIEVLFVDLDGRGIRGMTRVSTGYLLLAGPVGHEAVSFRVYHWDGEDMVPGERTAEDSSLKLGQVTLLGTVPVPSGAKAEGLTVFDESQDTYELLVVFDGAKDGAPTRLSVRKVPGL